jgi:hypothetical protein
MKFTHSWPIEGGGGEGGAYLPQADGRIRFPPDHFHIR